MLNKIQEQIKQINITQAIIFSLLGATAYHFYQSYQTKK